MVFNTLTQNKVEFVPKSGNSVKWYICGPTVYDSSHLGHARTYVAFDVIRRVLSDYYGYDIFCVMNVTDIDDKIILRARRNHLLKQYREAKPPLDSVMADAAAELAKALSSHDEKAMKLDGEVAQEKSSANKKAMQAELDTLAYKRGALVEHQATIEKAKAGGIKVSFALMLFLKCPRFPALLVRCIHCAWNADSFAFSYSDVAFSAWICGRLHFRFRVVAYTFVSVWSPTLSFSCSRLHFRSHVVAYTFVFMSGSFGLQVLLPLF